MVQKIITSFPYRGITNNQLFTLSNQVYSLLSNELPKNNPFIQDVLQDISQTINNLEEALGRVSKSGYTQKKDELDDTRDDLLIGFKKQVKSNLRHFKKGKREAAALLIEILERREPSLQRLTFAENTAELDLLFADMDIEKPQQALAQLNLMSWYEELKKVNEQFKALVQEQVDKESSEDTPLLQTTKKELLFYFRVIFSKIAYYTLKGQEPYPAVMEKIADLVTDIKAVAEARETRKEKSGEETPTSL